MRSLAFVLVAAVVACHKPAPIGVTEAGAPAAACASTVAAYDALMFAGGACASGADCTCAKGGVSPRFPCGDPTDKVTAAKLDKLTSDFEAARCDGLLCSATVCKTECSAGHCMKLLNR